MSLLKINIIIYLLAFFFVCTPQLVVAQTPQQLMEAIQNGSIDPAMLSPDQRALLEGRMPANPSEPKDGFDYNDAINEKKALAGRRDTSVKRTASRNNIEQTYGSGIFMQAAVTDLTELSVPPADYKVGVGDEIIISLWGGGELQERYTVSKDGSIFPKGIGKIHVGGLSFQEITSIITTKFKRVTPSSTKVSVSMGKPRSININVVGNVVDPGPMTVSAFSNAFHVIAKAGGVTEIGDLRSIQIKRGGVVIDELDVYKYLTTGDFGKHIYLENNDFIIVGFYQKKVLATGQFKRPMYYQLKQQEGLKALLQFSGGLNADAWTSTIHILRKENEQEVLRNVNARSFAPDSTSDFILRDGDVVKVDLIKKGVRNRVEMLGEVRYPGTYEIKPSERLFDLIHKAGGITSNTVLEKAYVFRGGADSTNLSPERLEINLERFDENNTDDSSNIELKDYDIVQLLSKTEFGTPQTVEVFGEVQRPGKFRRFEKMTLQDLLLLSGGLKAGAEFRRVEISSVVSMDTALKSIKPTKTTIRSYSIKYPLTKDSLSATVLLNPYDQVFVRKNPEFELQDNVEIRGQVHYPGLYTKINKGEKLASFIARSGGVLENADWTGAYLIRKPLDSYRKKITERNQFDIDSSGRFKKDTSSVLMDDFTIISIDLRKALKRKKSSFNVVLQDGDIIVIPASDPFVQVQGKVQSAIKIPYDSKHRRVRYYIDKAGGFGVKPWRKRIFITYANGKSRRTRNFLFLHFYPKVRPGSMVTVPTRPQGQEFSDILKTTLASVITVVTTAIIFKYIK